MSSGNVPIGQVNGPQHPFQVIRVDVPIDGKAQEAHIFLAVQQKNDPGIPLALDPGNQALPRRFEKTLLELWLQSREREEHPKDIPGRHQDFLQ